MATSYKATAKQAQFIESLAKRKNVTAEECGDFFDKHNLTSADNLFGGGFTFRQAVRRMSKKSASLMIDWLLSK